MSTVEGVQYHGGTQITKDFSLTVLMISPHVHHDIPHGTEHAHGTAHTLYRLIIGHLDKGLNFDHSFFLAGNF